MLTVSGGTFCLPALLLRNYGIRSAAMPFDWTFCNVESLVKILESEFYYFLDKNALTSRTGVVGRRCATNNHYDAGNVNRPFFNHKDPTLVADQQYYYRCIERFLQLKGDSSILFVLDERQDLKVYWDRLVSALVEHFPGMRLFAVNYSQKSDGHSSLSLHREKDNHRLFDFFASKIVDGSSFREEDDGRLLLNELRSV